MKWTNSYRSFGLKTKRSTGLKTIEHKQEWPRGGMHDKDMRPCPRRTGGMLLCNHERYEYSTNDDAPSSSSGTTSGAAGRHGRSMVLTPSFVTVTALEL